MKKTKKVLAVLLCLCVAAVMMPASAFAAETETKADVKSGDIVILHTNDVHCSVDSHIGYAGLAAYREDRLKETDYVTLVDAGDAVQGDTIGALSKGEYIIELMNVTGYDVAVPGNHEFDFGMDKFLRLAAGSNAEYVSANFTGPDGDTVFEPYTIKTYGATKVAFVGISTPETVTKSTPAYFQDENGNYIYGFCSGNNGRDLYSAVQKAVDSAREEGADYVIAVAHLGIDEQSSPWTSKEVIANTSGIDAMIDGHSHSVVTDTKVRARDGRQVILTQTGTGLSSIGEIIITADGKITSSLIADYTKKDSDVESAINKIKDNIKAITSKVIGTSEVTLNDYDAEGNRLVRNQESVIGNFCADAYRAVTGADIGLVQGGGVRAPIKKGEVTYGDMIAANPWANSLGVVEATGQQILDALEHGAKSAPGEDGGFLQVSGLTYDIDTTVPSTVKTDENGMFLEVSGARRVSGVKVNGHPIDPAKSYTVASTLYILTQQGDGFTMFKGAKEITKEASTDSDALIQYLQKHLNGKISQTYAKTEGRIGIIRICNSRDEEEAIENAGKEAVKAYKSALARTTKITSASASKKTKKITVKISGNSKADGFYYHVYTAKSRRASYLSKTGKTFTTRKLAKGTYTVKVTPYTYVAGEKVYGKVTTKKVSVR